MQAIGDTAMWAAEHALRGIAMRADVRSRNVANAETPGYRAKTVSFENALAAALSGDVDTQAPSIVDAPGTPDELGNTVSIEEEFIGGMKDNVLYETLIESYNAKLGMLRTAIGRR